MGKRILMIVLTIMSTIIFTYRVNALEINSIDMLDENLRIKEQEMQQNFISQAPKELIELYNEGNLTLNASWFDEDGNFDTNYRILTQYQETQTYYKNGKAIESESKVITKEEYDAYAINDSNITTLNSNSTNSTNVVIGNCELSSYLYNDCWETSAKRITLAVKDGYPNNARIVIINTWKTIPSVKSYDSIGFYSNGNFTITNAYGYQKYDGNTISYSYNGDNMKLATNGVSISQNIVDSVSSSLSNELYVHGNFINSAHQITASYQHAVNNISLETSKNFAFSGDGMGRVFDWNTSYSNWDNMQGVCANITSAYLWFC